MTEGARVKRESVIVCLSPSCIDHTAEGCSALVGLVLHSRQGNESAERESPLVLLPEYI
jgi:hypothetical protein